MDNQNLENLRKIAKVFQPENIITSTEIDQVLKGIMEILATYKKGTEEINKDTISTVNTLLDKCSEMIKEIKSEHKDSMEEMYSEYDSKMAEITSILKEIKSIEVKHGEDGKDADEEKIIEEVLAQIKLPEYKETIITGEEIIDKLNDLPITEENQIDFSRIKNVPLIKGKPIHSPTNISTAVDLDTSTRADGYSIVWDAARARHKYSAGGSGSPGGSDTQLQYNNAGSFGGISGATTNGTAVTYSAGNLIAADVTASGSGGFLIQSNNGTDVGLFGAGGGAGATFYGGVNLNTMTQGSVLFAGSSGAITQDNSNLFWDDTNNRLGLGTATPSATLHVAGQGGTAGFSNSSR